MSSFESLVAFSSRSLDISRMFWPVCVQGGFQCSLNCLLQVPFVVQSPSFEGSWCTFILRLESTRFIGSSKSHIISSSILLVYLMVLNCALVSHLPMHFPWHVVSSRIIGCSDRSGPGTHRFSIAGFFIWGGSSSRVLDSIRGCTDSV